MAEPRWPACPARTPQGVYVYRIDVDSTPRYVGAGSGDRAWEHFKLARKGSTVPFHVYLREGVSADSEITVHIIKDGLSREIAHLIETSLIDSYGRFILAQGPLLNLGDGGKYNGQRMHTARAYHLKGLSSPFKPHAGGRRRPSPRVRRMRNLIHGAKFGVDRDY